MEPAKTLIDSGSSRNFINKVYVREKNIPTAKLANQKLVIAIDGKEIEDVISEKTELQIEVEGKTLKCDLYVMPLGDTEIILGKDWLDEAEPVIAWKDLTITYKDHISGKAATEEPVIPKEFADFLDLFQEEGFRELPPHREEFDCAIDLIEGAELPKPAKTYPMTPAESEALEKYIEQELKDGKIRRSQSSMAAPCFYVNKADGGLRLVVDYRKLNAITKPYRFPMPVQTELLEQLKDAKIFSKMDIRWGFTEGSQGLNLTTGRPLEQIGCLVRPFSLYDVAFCHLPGPEVLSMWPLKQPRGLLGHQQAPLGLKLSFRHVKRSSGSSKQRPRVLWLASRPRWSCITGK
ncbi:Transposon Tf2-1 polyprotein [Ceratobasidium sp. AG-Ba]|nr:Transposon Tf2-1 polyprotein [Ceratobasidium sp. AG-Ba]